MKKIYELWYSLIRDDEPNKIELLERYTEEEIYNLRLFKECKKEYLEKAEDIYKYILENNISYITIKKENYPENLKNIDYPPYLLYYKGNLDVLKRRIVAIVGARKCTNYGIEVTKILTNLLNSYNISIISGGARGIDTVSHRVCLENGIPTIVVLGCGINIAYPRENKSLFEVVQKRGLILSEFPPNTQPYKMNFPQRNRIISALSEIVIVTEAAKNSGSLITANYASKQGKDVMAVPGSILSGLSKGTNELIEDGAIVISDFDSIRVKLKLPLDDSDGNLNEFEQKINNIITNEPIHINDLVKSSKMEYTLILKTLFKLQEKNKVVCLPGEYYVKTT
ncbi:MAG: DNA-processing protein DprA [Clostridium sp.]|nr:DNA-processing protein DprA [Clostridium sp.]